MAETEAKAGAETEAKAGAETEAKAGTEMEAKVGTETEAKAGTETEAKAGTETAVCQPVVRARQLGWCHVSGWGCRVLGWRHDRTIAGGSRSGLRSFRVLAKSVLAPQDVHPLP